MGVGTARARVVVAAVALAWTGASDAAGWAGADSFVCHAFSVVSAPKIIGGNTVSLAATSLTDVWAVGHSLNGDHRPTILHWDGTRWSTSPQDDVRGSATSVTAISPSDAWMVGYTGQTGIAKHWDGASWLSTPVPFTGTQEYLFSVSAVATDDVWAVGNHVDVGIHPFVIHWDGVAWTQVYAPDGVEDSTNTFYGVSAVSTDDVWAVGFNDLAFLQSQPLIEHWDGTAWAVVPSPTFPGNDNFLFSVSGAASDDVWAVGNQGDSGTATRTLAEHWDGTSWTVVFTPDVTGTDDALFDVQAVAPDDAWAAGLRHLGSGAEATLAEHWDGAHWQVVKTPTKYSGSLGAILEVTSTIVWAVGGISDPSFSDLRPLTMTSTGC